jgi:hypothetical protein
MKQDNPDFRATIVRGRLTLVGWHPGLMRPGGPCAKQFRQRGRAGVVVADLRILRDPDPWEVVAMSSGASSAKRRARQWSSGPAFWATAACGFPTSWSNPSPTLRSWAVAPAHGARRVGRAGRTTRGTSGRPFAAGGTSRWPARCVAPASRSGRRRRDDEPLAPGRPRTDVGSEAGARLCTQCLARPSTSTTSPGRRRPAVGELGGCQRPARLPPRRPGRPLARFQGGGISRSSTSRTLLAALPIAVA